MKVVYTDVLVIGGGLTGLRLAVGVKRRGHDVVILSLVPPKRSHSAAAQGGMQASLANVIKGEHDTEDVHFEDTVRGSDWGADQDVVRMFVSTAPKAVRELAAWGVPWSRVRRGDRQVIINGQPVTLTERDEAHGLIAQRDFGGTKKWRTCYCADATGHSMLFAVSDQAIASAIPVHERMEAIALIHEAGRCYGAIVRNLVTGELIAYVAKATALAGGGAGRIYRVTTNAVICEGITSAIALETGIATLGNMEAIQFHPTPIFPAGILLTEGCRGDGGLLKDVDGTRFMPDYEPEKKELASRDVVSRRMEQHIRKGKGVKTRWGDHLWLDITLLGKKHITTNLREVNDIAHYFLGLDPVKDWLPVRPAQHYTMGGVRTNYTGESPTLKGLFAAGETACWDMHGFNRLGGNSVAETVVAGMIVGEFVADFCDKISNEMNVPTGAHPRGAGSRAGEARRDLEGPRHRGSERGQSPHAGGDDRQGGHLPYRTGSHERGRGVAAAARTQPRLRPRLQGYGLQSGARHRLPHAEDAQARALRRLRRAAAHREPRRALPRGLPAPQRWRLAQAHARELERFQRDAADAQLRGARRLEDGAAARLARLRREGLYRPSGHAGTAGAGGCDPPAAWRHGSLQGAGSAAALRIQAAGTLSRPQRAHRRAAARRAGCRSRRAQQGRRLRAPRPANLNGDRAMSVPPNDHAVATPRAATTVTVPVPKPGARANGNGAGKSSVPPRELEISVLRFNPQEPGSVPRMQAYRLQEDEGMTLFMALNEIREKQDPSLQFDFVCRAGICGSCAMVINGRPTLACRTLTKNLPRQISLAPLPFFELIGDLSVDTGKWMRAMSERLQTWVHRAQEEIDLRRMEERMDPDLAEKIFELDRCIECGCCLAGCGTARMRSDFVGAVGINKIARFRLDPRDNREDEAFYEVVGTDDGVFGCMSLLGCHDVCPKELPLATQIAFVRRKMAKMGW